jgi:hypothetical protein
MQLARRLLGPGVLLAFAVACVSCSSARQPAESGTGGQASLLGGSAGTAGNAGSAVAAAGTAGGGAASGGTTSSAGAAASLGGASGSPESASGASGVAGSAATGGFAATGGTGNAGGAGASGSGDSGDAAGAGSALGGPPAPMSQYLGLPDRTKIVRAPTGFWIWCPSIIKVGATYHLFVSIIPYSGTWTADSKVARYEASDLYGPYTYKGIVLQPGGWITSMIHNPKVFQDPVSKKYVIVFIGNSVNTIGYADADSITGPWQFSSTALAGVSMSNPSPIDRQDGSTYLLGRVKANYNGVLSSLIRAYSGTRYGGPYTRISANTNNLIAGNYGVEDPCVWFANNQYHLIGTDWVPLLTGGSKNGVQYYSNDGVKYYPVSSSPLFVKSNFKFSDGSVISNTRIERPQVVLDDQDEVIALLVALGDGGDTSLMPEESGISIIPVNNYNP